MHILFFLALMAVSCGYAIGSGGAPERAAAAIVLAATVATMLVGWLDFHAFAQAEWGIAAVDAATFVAFLLLAVRADRFWPMALAACAGIGVMAHGAILLSAERMPLVYAMFHAFSGYPALLILATGTWRHRRRLKASGTDRSWSTSSPPAARARPAPPPTR